MKTYHIVYTHTVKDMLPVKALDQYFAMEKAQEFAAKEGLTEFCIQEAEEEGDE
jgi:hypothetical protein